MIAYAGEDLVEGLRKVGLEVGELADDTGAGEPDGERDDDGGDGEDEGEGDSVAKLPLEFEPVDDSGHDDSDDDCGEDEEEDDTADPDEEQGREEADRRENGYGVGFFRRGWGLGIHETEYNPPRLQIPCRSAHLMCWVGLRLQLIRRASDGIQHDK